MKKSGITAVLAAFALLMSACGGNTAKTIDIQALADSLATEIAYDDELEALGEDAASIYFELEEGVEVALYMGSGSTAEEVAVFSAPDEETARTQLGHVQDYLDDQAESFRDYIPEEAKRAEDAVLVQKGSYVVLCASGDPDKAGQMIEEAFK